MTDASHHSGKSGLAASIIWPHGEEKALPGRFGTVAAALMMPAVVMAQGPSGEQPETAAVVLPQVDVVASSPLLGSGVDRNKVPAQTNVLTGRDISSAGYPDALRALNETVPGVTLDNAAGNPFQP